MATRICAEAQGWSVKLLEKPVWFAPDVVPELRIKPWATFSLITVLIAVHALAPAQAPLVFGADLRSIVEDEEWYRAVTAVFLHAGVVHLLANCWSLLFLGWLAERAFGSRRMLTTFLISGVLGTAATLVGFDNVLVFGASDGLTALAAALVPFALHRWSRLKPIFKRSFVGGLFVLLVVFYHDHLATGPSAYAHVPGLLLGLAFGWFYRRGVRGVSESMLRPDAEPVPESVS